MSTGLAHRLLLRVRERGRPQPTVMLVDGRSGSGKTTLGGQLAQATGAQLVHMDELYAGWDGLAVGSASVATVFDRGQYRRFDWNTGQYADTVHVHPSRPLVIEGCGSLTTENLAAAQRWVQNRQNPEQITSPAAGGHDPANHVLTVWIECAETLRFDRAIARDGEMFRPHWKMWAAQETALYARERPWSLATEQVQSR